MAESKKRPARKKAGTAKRSKAGDRFPPVPNTGSEAIPPGATRKAFDRPEDRGGGPPGSGAGPRHASADPGTANESEGREEVDLATSSTDPDLEAVEDDTTPYGGISGGAVGGTPADKRSSGGHHRGGIAPGGAHRGDSTIGADPNEDAA